MRSHFSNAGGANIKSAVLFQTQPGLAITSVTVDVASYSFPGQLQQPGLRHVALLDGPRPPQEQTGHSGSQRGARSRKSARI